MDYLIFFLFSYDAKKRFRYLLIFLSNSCKPVSMPITVQVKLKGYAHDMHRKNE